MNGVALDHLEIGCTDKRVRPEHDVEVGVPRYGQALVGLNHNCAQSNSYYFDHHGDAPMLRPSTSVEMFWRAKHLPMDHYRFSGYNNRRGMILHRMYR